MTERQSPTAFAIRAIQREARTAALDEVEDAIEGLTVRSVITGTASVAGYVRADVLAAIASLREDPE